MAVPARRAPQRKGAFVTVSLDPPAPCLPACPPLGKRLSGEDILLLLLLLLHLLCERRARRAGLPRPDPRTATARPAAARAGPLPGGEPGR